MSGERNPAYKGGTVVYTNGSNYGYRQRYIRGKRYKQPEHRFIMEQMLRRKFKPSEAVHHINGDTLDNRPENLIVMTRKEHSSFHLKKSPMNIHNLLNRIVTLEKENELLKQQFVTS
uniref:Putative homing endonuclease n=1 Tax=viral metagenome TaxID=1070528 RepID=A0A6H1ZIY6_9ZZZZ